VLAVGGDDAVLAVNMAVLAHRYGAGAARMGGPLDVPALLRGRRAYAVVRSTAAEGGWGGLPPGVEARRRGGPQGGEVGEKRPPLLPRRQRCCVIDMSCDYYGWWCVSH